MERIELLANPIWTNQDIMDFVGCSSTKAVQIRKKAIFECNGIIPMCPKKVYRNAVLKAVGLNYETELENYRLFKLATAIKPTDESL